MGICKKFILFIGNQLIELSSHSRIEATRSVSLTKEESRLVDQIQK